MFAKDEKGKGFTLIELMIVVAVIALLILVLVPRIGLIKDKSREAGIRENMVTLEGTIHAVIDDYPATDTGVDSLELRIQRDLNSVTAVNQRMRNPVTGNPDDDPAAELVCNPLVDIAEGAVVFDTTDDADNGTGINAIWGDPTVPTDDTAGSAGTIAYCAYVNTAVTPHRINVRLIPFGVNNVRIPAMEKVISQ